MRVIGIALGALLGISSASAQDCNAQLVPFAVPVPWFPGAPVWADVLITNVSADDTDDCESAGDFGWVVAVDIFCATLPMPPDPTTVLVCASGGGLGSFFCSPAVITQQPGGPPFVYSYDSTETDFELDCNGKLSLTLEWNAGLGYITLLRLDMTCGDCNLF